jgi:hypothetical protein
MTEQPDVPVDAETIPPDVIYALEPDPLPNHPLRAQDVQALVRRHVG